MINNVSLVKNTLTYAKITGLRSMQNITGLEREIIEANKAELTHEIWGNPQKLIEWAKNKFEQLRVKDYKSELLEKDAVNSSRNELVKAWADILRTDFKTANNPLLQLKIMQFITHNLRIDNKALAPILRVDVFQDALFLAKKTGKSFKSVYTNLLKQPRYHNINVTEENVQSGNVRGTWYHLRTLNQSESVRFPKLAQQIQEFVMSISKGSNWCIRNKYRLESEYTGTKFHIFVDDKDMPQLCLAAADDAEKTFYTICGREQYKPIPSNFRQILQEFLQKNNLTDFKIIENDGRKTSSLLNA